MQHASRTMRARTCVRGATKLGASAPRLRLHGTLHACVAGPHGCRWALGQGALQHELARARQHLLFFSGLVPDAAPWDYTGRGGIAAHKRTPGFYVLRKGADKAVDFAQAMRVSGGRARGVQHTTLSDCIGQAQCMHMHICACRS